MARSKLPEKEKVSYNLPSRFGSHSVMVNEEKTKTLTDANLVCLSDEHGDYVTERNRVDTGMADPNRYAENRLSKLFARNNEVITN